MVGDNPYSVQFKVDIPLETGTHNYAGHKITDIKIAPSDSAVELFSSPMQNKDAISNVSLAVLRGKVNPARYDAENALEILAKEFKIAKKQIQGWLNYYSGDINSTLNRVFREYDLTNKAQKKGYDGIIYNNGIEYVVFSPNQIKSVDNRGTFDPENPNIYHQTGVKEIDSSELYNRLPKDLKDAVDFIFTAEPVYNITGNEFPDNGTDLKSRVLSFFKNEYNNVIKDTPVGDVLIDDRAYRSTKSHGLSNIKVNAFKAVPNVLKNGKLVRTQKQYNGKSENRYLFVAPVSVVDKNGNNLDYFAEVIVREGISKDNNGKRRLYIHEVELKNKLADVFTTSYNTSTPASSKSIISKLIAEVNSDGKLYQRAYSGEFSQVRDLPKKKKKIKGEFSVLEKSIDFTKDADFSTLPHEFAHFWLDNIWNYVESGLASQEYLEQFNEVRKFLGLKKGEYPTQKQHEKFARAYEKYLYKGEVPNSVIGTVFSHYENFIRDVYNDITEIDTMAGLKSYQPISKGMYDFFNSMVSGNLPKPAIFVEDEEDEYNSSFAKYVKAYKKHAESMSKKLIKKNNRKINVFATWMFFNSFIFFLLYFKNIHYLFDAMLLSFCIFAISDIIMDVFKRNQG